MPRKIVHTGGCSSCGFIGGCGCSIGTKNTKNGGSKKKTKKSTIKGGSLITDLVEGAKTLAVPFSLILAKQTLQNKLDKPKKSTKKPKNKQSKKGGGNILNVMK